MNKLWWVREITTEDLEKVLNTLSKSHTIFSLFAHGHTVTVVAFKDANEAPKRKAPKEK